MSDIWEGAIWNKNGELVANIYKEPPRHTYKEIDCGGECGGCVALVVDGQVVSGPPFHKHCKCSLSQSKIDAAIEQESNMNNIVAPDRNSESADVKWLKDALLQLGFYEPDIRAGETENSINEYPNQNLFNAINKFQREHNLSERGSVAPGHQTEAKINRELKEQTKPPKEDFVYNGNTFSGPIGIIDKQYALFNGTSLSVYEDDKKIAEWPAVSGQPEYQNPQYQNKKEVGPIPAGVYVARKKDLQNRKLETEKIVRQEYETSSTGFLQELEILFKQIIFKKPIAAGFYVFLFLFLMLLELLVVMSKGGDGDSDYDLVVHHQQRIKAATLKRMEEGLLSK